MRLDNPMNLLSVEYTAMDYVGVGQVQLGLSHACSSKKLIAGNL